MSYDIGTARGVIEMEYNGRGIDQAKEDLGSLDEKGKKAGYTLDDTANKSGAAGALIAAGLGLAINSAANFEQRMSAVEAVSGATAGEMEKLSDKALQLGKDTSFSATDSASAIEELVKAGISVEDVLNGAADATVALAAAGEIALPEAATIASNAMNQFGLTAEELPKVADLIAGAANASAIDVSDLGQSMQQAGAVANLAGVSFEDTATAIALMGNAGIKGSDAGTSLKSMLMRLQPTTKKQTDLMRSLGIITEDGANKFYDAEGNTKSLADISGVLAGSLKGMSKQQKQATLNTLFGSDAIRAAAIMADNGRKGFNGMNEALNKTTAAEVAATRMDNLKGRIEEMKGSAETVGIALGTALLPIIEKLVGWLTKAANWFLGLSDSQQKWVAGSLAAVAALLLIVAGVIKLILIFGKLQATLAVLRIALAGTWVAALGPIGLIIAAIALVVAIIVVLWKRSQTFRTIVIGAWNAVKNATVAAFKAVVNAIRSAWNFVVSNTKQAGSSIRGAVVSAWNAIKSAVSNAVNAVRTAISKAWNTVKTNTTSAWNAVREFIKSAWDKIKTAVTQGVDNVITVVKGLKDKALGALGDARTWLVDKGKDIILGLVDGINAMAQKVKDAVGAVVGAAARLLPGSPVKEGPLTVLNRGYAGKEIVRMVIGGIESMSSPVAMALGDTLNVPTGQITDSPTGRVRKRSGGGRGAKSTVVSGDLTLVGGRAYISGIAEDVYDGFDDDNNRRGN